MQTASFLTTDLQNEIRSLIREEQRALFLEFFGDKQFQSKVDPDPQEQKLSIPQLAEYLNCTKATIHNYKKRGVFPYYQTGRTVFFKKREVDQALEVGNKKKGAVTRG